MTLPSGGSGGGALDTSVADTLAAVPIGSLTPTTGDAAAGFSPAAAAALSLAAREAVAEVEGAKAVGPGRYCSPRHSTQCVPLLLESYGVSDPSYGRGKS
jgi:hypothetical protein